ncbi:MAG TPA: cytochrome c oxidase assembly protein [Gemmatimonadaceae bacterium]|nr:cytochrome c oxidase assembly protein [Gemmatimonadaceae bacterium]
MLHAAAPVDGPLGWSWEPGAVASLVMIAAAYAAGAYRLRARARLGRAVARRGVAAFAAGWLVTAVALLSPLHALGERRFSAHMVQHELLMVVAAPLLVLARPLPAMVWALPRRARLSVAGWGTGRLWRGVWAVASAPVVAWWVHALAIWLWHVPAAYDAALGSEALHALEHMSFLGAAVLYWWSVLRGGRGRSGVGVLSLFTTAVHTSVLGALLTFAPHPLYAAYVERGIGGVGAGVGAAAALADQQLAGLVMWVPAAASYVIVALCLMVRWIREADARAARAELTLARLTGG